MGNYLKPQSPLFSKENDAFFYPLTTSDQVILPDGSRLNQEGLEGMITPDGIGAAVPPVLLWENASPTSAFAAQDIGLSLEPGDFLFIPFASYGQQRDFTLITVESYEKQFVSGDVNDTDYRLCKINSNGITFTEVVSSSSGSYAIQIPLKIYRLFRGTSA